MRKLFILIVLIGVSALNLFAGRYAGDFMNIGAGVRALGMGGAFAAVSNDGSAIYWNPSGISQLRSSEVSAMHAFLYNGLASYDNISFCQPLPNDVTIGFNVTRLTISDIPYFDEEYLLNTNVDQRINNSNLHLPGVPDGKFKSVDDLYQFAFAKHLHYKANLGWLFFEVPFDLHVGGNIKYIKRQIKDNLGTGTGVDLGMLLKTDLGTIFDIDGFGDIAIGINFQDVSGTEISWDTTTEHRDEVLFNTKVGLALIQPIEKLKSKVVLAYDSDHVYNGTKHYGLEWEYNDIGSIRAGYYDSNFTCGASIRVYGIMLDYALVNNPIGLTNRLGMRVSF